MDVPYVSFRLDYQHPGYLPPRPEYAFVVTDWRGYFGSSDAAYSGSPTRGEDGHDLVEWISTQSWCTGAVGTWAASALGIVQMKTAAEQPDHLLACVPIVHHYRETYEPSYPGGVFRPLLARGGEFLPGTSGGRLFYRKRRRLVPIGLLAPCRHIHFIPVLDRGRQFVQYGPGKRGELAHHLLRPGRPRSDAFRRGLTEGYGVQGPGDISSLKVADVKTNP